MSFVKRVSQVISLNEKLKDYDLLDSMSAAHLLMNYSLVYDIKHSAILLCLSLNNRVNVTRKQGVFDRLNV